MKRILAVFALFFMHGAIAQDVWIQRDSVNGPPRGACSSFELNGEAFVVTGVNVEEFKRKMYSYDLEQDDWDNELALGGETGVGLERASAVGFSANGKGYLALGATAGTYMKDVWEYDPEAEAWTQKADYMGSGRSGAIAFSVDDMVYVGLGQDSEGLKDDFYRFDGLTNTWEELDDFTGGARKEAVGFRMGGKGYVGTGRGESTYYADFWEYDPTEDNWRRLADFPGKPRTGAVGCGVFPSAFVMLGYDNDFSYRNDVWEYNYFGDIWTQRANYPGGERTQASAIVVDDRIFVGLGYDGMYHDDFYEYERVLSVGETLEINDFSVYPNPVLTEFSLTYPKSVAEFSLQFFDAAGRDITSNLQVIKSGNRFNIKAHQKLESGTYFVQISEGEEVLGSKKIIVSP